MVSRDIARLAEANLVDGDDSELVLCVLHQTRHQVLGGLQIPGNVTLGPVFSLSSLTLHHVADDLTTPIVRWFGPGQTDGALSGIYHLGEGRGGRRIWRGEKILSEKYEEIEFFVDFSIENKF